MTKKDETYKMEKVDESIKLNDIDLIKKKYPLDILIKNVNNLSATGLVNHQKLDADFCKKYILNEDYHCCVEESYKITIEYVLKHI
jgi:hypothetical protein